MNFETDHDYDSPEEAIEAAKRETHGKGPIGFEGHNCNDFRDDEDHCEGWFDGDSRCLCGNRRVTWMTDQDRNGKYYAYAAAY